jgi:PAS domain S-box-containing protein
VEVSVQTLENDGGRNFAFIHDITARKEAEQALRNSEERYRILFSEMLSGFALHEIICDENGKPINYRFLAVNSAFEELTGLKADEIIGKTVLEILPVVEPFWIERYGKVALQGMTDHFEGYSAGAGKHYEARAFCPEPGKFAVMFHDVTERKQAENDLRIALTKYRTLFNTIPIGVTVSDKAGNILESNAVAEKMLGLSQENQGQRSIDDEEWQIVRPDGTLMPPEEFASVMALKEKRLVENVEMGVEKSKDETTWISVTADLLPLEGYGVVIAYSDITERKHAEENLKNLLSEKEILLAEVHHRVKNNLQVVSSLLNLQSEGIDDERILAVLEESRNRIQSMTLVHEQLYRSHEYAQIDLRAYVDQLVSTLFNMYEVEPDQIQLKLDAKDVKLDLERAIPCGLLLNELITNSLKYAFPKDTKGHIKIKIKPSSEKLLLEFSDNGVGLPKHIDFHNTQSLGLQLIYLLTTHDLHGNITLEREKGTRYRIDIPMSHHNQTG